MVAVPHLHHSAVQTGPGQGLHHLLRHGVIGVAHLQRLRPLRPQGIQVDPVHRPIGELLFAEGRAPLQPHVLPVEGTEHHVTGGLDLPLGEGSGGLKQDGHAGGVVHGAGIDHVPIAANMVKVGGDQDGRVPGLARIDADDVGEGALPGLQGALDLNRGTAAQLGKQPLRHPDAGAHGLRRVESGGGAQGTDNLPHHRSVGSQDLQNVLLLGGGPELPLQVQFPLDRQRVEIHPGAVLPGTAVGEMGGEALGLLIGIENLLLVGLEVVLQALHGLEPQRLELPGDIVRRRLIPRRTGQAAGAVCPRQGAEVCLQAALRRRGAGGQEQECQQHQGPCQPSSHPYPPFLSCRSAKTAKEPAAEPFGSCGGLFQSVKITALSISFRGVSLPAGTVP